MPNDADSSPFVSEASPQQQQLWFLDQLDPNMTAYNIPLGYNLSGPMDYSAMERAVKTVVARHETLRTRFQFARHQVLQIVESEAQPQIEFVSLTDEYNPARRQKKAQELILEEASYKFDLEKGPLVRVMLTKLECDKHVLVFNIHHIILDHQSALQFCDEFCAAYESISRGRMPDLEEVKLQYRDFSVWQEGQLKDANVGEKLEGWVKKLEEFPTSLQFPRDRPRSRQQDYRGREERFEFSAELTERIKAFSRSSRQSVFVTLLASFKCILARYSGQNDIIVGCPFSNRLIGGFEKVMGCCMNTLPLGTKLSEARTFADVVELVNRTVQEAYSLQHIPFKTIVDKLDQKRDPAIHPFYQVSFSYQDPPVALSLDGVEVEPLDLHNGSSKFDFMISAWENDWKIGGLLEFNPDLFDRDTMLDFVKNLEEFLSSALADPELNWKSIPLLHHDQIERLLTLSCNDPVSSEYPVHKTVGQLIEDQTERVPERVAVMFENEQMSYQELDRRANFLARRLLEEGVEPNDLVGVFLDRSAEMVVALLAIWKAGGAYVPLDPAHPADRVDVILEDVRPKLVLTERDLVDKLPAARVRAMALDDTAFRLRGQCADAPEQHTVPSDLAYILFTSGSTGRPKGVEIEHRSVVNLLWSICDEPGFEESDKMLSVTTISFDTSVAELFLPLINGGVLIVAPRDTLTDGDALRALLESSGATFMLPTPGTWRLLLEAGWTGAEDLKMISTGEPLSPELAGKLLPLGKGLWNLYGPTETTIWATGCRIMESADVHIGRPIANTQVYVVNSEMQLQPRGAPGELMIAGLGLARGYLNRSNLTAENFIRNPFGEGLLYRTGDLAKWRSDGALECMGRTDFQVKIRGYRIELGEIEYVLSGLTSVKQSVVVARDERLIAFYVSRSNKRIEPSELRDALRSALPEYMMPAIYVHLEKIPLTPNGKIDRKALPDGSLGEAVSSDGYVPPQNEEEEKLVALWEELLKIKPIGIHDNFFDIGGDSILAIQITNRARDLGFETSPAMMFRSQTVHELASVTAQSADRPTVQDCTRSEFADAKLKQDDLSEIMREFDHEDNS